MAEALASQPAVATQASASACAAREAQEFKIIRR